MRNVLRCLGVALLAGLLAACESDEPPVYDVELPGYHDLGHWLENHLSGPGATSAGFIVPAGQYHDAGGVRFSCPAMGADCEVSVTRGCTNIMATGGRVTAENHMVTCPTTSATSGFKPGFDRSCGAVPRRGGRGLLMSRRRCGHCEVTFPYSYSVPVLSGSGSDVDVDLIPGAVSVGGAVTADLVPLPDEAPNNSFASRQHRCGCMLPRWRMQPRQTTRSAGLDGL